VGLVIVSWAETPSTVENWLRQILSFLATGLGMNVGGLRWYITLQMLLLLAAGMGMIVSGLLWIQVQKPTFSILLTAAAGDVAAHSHRDEIFILVRVEVNATLPILEFVSIKAFSSLEVVGVLVSPVDL
jgi:hypothetical protein